MVGALGADPILTGSRTPTIIDLVDGTLHPIEEFLDRDADPPLGRNSIEGIWPPPPPTDN